MPWSTTWPRSASATTRSGAMRPRSSRRWPPGPTKARAIASETLADVRRVDGLWTGPRRPVACLTMRLAELELDLDVFAGPFDLLLTLILREEVDLLEVDLADIVISYIDHLERARRARSRRRHRVPRADRGAAGAQVPPAAARRGGGADRARSRRGGRGAAGPAARRPPLSRRRRASGRAAVRSRAATASAPPRRHGFLRRASLQDARPVYDPARLRRRARPSCSRLPPTGRRPPHARAPGLGGRAARAPARAPAPRQRSPSTRRSARADRVTVAVTLFAVLELYKQGELTWTPGAALRRDHDRAPRAPGPERQAVSA